MTEQEKQVVAAAIKWVSAFRQKEWTDNEVKNLCGSDAADLMLAVKAYQQSKK